MTPVLRLIGCVVFWGLVMTSAALAQAPTVPAYGGRGGDVSKSLDKGEVVGQTQTLPFTGLDVSLMIGAALVLIALGITLKKTARKRG